MTHSRSLLLNGLSLLLRRLPAVLWTFLFSVATAILFTLRLHGQFSALLDHSLASASLVHGFDLTTVAGVMLRLEQNVPGGGSFSFSAVGVFLVLYFILVPGVLFCYLTGERARLSTLLRQGLLHFWRFVRITVVSLIAFGLVLGPLSALNTRWGTFVDDHIVGRTGFLLTLCGTLLLYLIASLIRLFFDLVEVYTVQLGLTLRPNGRPDRRVRRAFGPAWRALHLHFVRLWGGFLLLSLVGLIAFALLGRTALHTLAQPRVWPLVLFSQLAVLLSIATRFWQRGAEVTLALDHPIVPPTAVTPPRTERVSPPAPLYTQAPIAYPPPPPVVPLPVTPPASAPYPSTSSAEAPLPPSPPVVAAPAAPLPIPSSADPGSLNPPGDLPVEQLPAMHVRADDLATDIPHSPGFPHTPLHPPPARTAPDDSIAPVHTVYDIDPFTPMPSAPNPLPTEVEETLTPREHPKREEPS